MKNRFVILLILAVFVFAVCGCAPKEEAVAKAVDEAEEEIIMFEGEYFEGSMGFENESYNMTFKNDSREISVIANEEPEIAYFIESEDGLPVENEDIKGIKFKVYYKEKNIVDENTGENIIILEYIASEVSE